MDIQNLYEGCMAAIDFGGTRIKIGLMKNGRLLDKKIIGADHGTGMASQLPLVADLINSMISDNKAGKIARIGMAFPGLVDPFRMKVLSTSKKYDDADRIDLEKYFRETFDASFFIDNDAIAAAAGEWQFGAGSGCNDMVMMTIGTGVGTAVIMEGRLLRGKHFQAGCLGGHFTVNYKGNACACGNTGCVEAEAATWNLAAKAGRHALFGESRLAGSSLVDFAALFDSAAKGDAVAGEIKRDCLNVWAAGIVSYIHAYDPEKVIVGGGVLKSKDEIIPCLQGIVNDHAWTPWGKVQVGAAALGDESALYGLLYLAGRN